MGGWGGRAGLAKRIDAPLAIIDKRRERPNESEVMNVIGEVDGPDLPALWTNRGFGWHAA